MSKIKIAMLTSSVVPSLPILSLSLCQKSVNKRRDVNDLALFEAQLWQHMGSNLLSLMSKLNNIEIVVKSGLSCPKNIKKIKYGRFVTNLYL